MDNCQQRILLNIKCIELAFSNKNIYVLAQKEKHQKRLNFGQTETIYCNDNTTEIQFQQDISCFYEVQEESKLFFLIIEKCQNRVHKKLGYAYFNFIELLESDDYLYLTDIIGSETQEIIGRIIIIGSNINNINYLLTLSFSGVNLMKRRKYFCCQNHIKDPELQICCYNQTVLKIKCTKTVPLVEWPIIKVHSSKLNNNNQAMRFDIKISEDSQIISHAQVTENQIRNQKIIPLYDIQNSDSYLGELRVGSISSKRVYSYEQFKKAGLKFSLMIAIDFSASNHPFTNIHSLHHYEENQTQQTDLSIYENAFQNIVKTLIAEGCEKEIYTYGFGFTIKGKKFSQFTQHCFPINENFQEPAIQVNVLQQTYRSFMQKIEFSFPTLFAPILTEAQRITNHLKTSANKLSYLILVILTDGQIQDLDQAFGKVIELCDSPISIIIIGVGNANFDDMEKLNNNDLTLSDFDGNRASRDIVQFVKFDDFQNNSKLLSQAVLKEVPYQVESYLNNHNYKGQETNRRSYNQSLHSLERRYVSSRGRDEHYGEDFFDDEIININQEQQLQGINEIASIQQQQLNHRQRTISNNHNSQGAQYKLSTVVPLNTTE